MKEIYLIIAENTDTKMERLTTMAFSIKEHAINYIEQIRKIVPYVSGIYYKIKTINLYED